MDAYKRGTPTTTISVKLHQADLAKLDELVKNWPMDGGTPKDWKDLEIDPEARWQSRYGTPTRGQVLRALIRQAKSTTTKPKAKKKAT